MPSLMPGTAGAKDAYGISMVRLDLSVKIPPKTLKHYKIRDGDLVVLTTTHRGDGGFALLHKGRAEASVFGKFISHIEKPDRPYWFQDKAYVLTPVREGRIHMTSGMLAAFNLNKEDRLMVVKSSTVAMSFTPIELWKEKFLKRGLTEAIENMSKLEVY
jgi:hypothetical protein